VLWRGWGDGILIMDLEQQKKIIYSDLVWLNINCFVLNKVKRFPAEELELVISFRTIIQSLVKNYFENSIVIIRRLLYETNSDFVSLYSMKNEVMEGKSQNEKDSIKNGLKKIKNLHTSMKKKVDSLRSSRLAHLKKNFNSEENSYEEISINKMERLVTSANELFSMLFGLAPETEFLPIDYSENSHFIDIDYILNCIAKRSELLRMSESNPQNWKRLVEKWNEEGSYKARLNAINYYRKAIWDLDSID